MVDRTAKGQLIERPVIVPTERGCLDGIYLRGDELPPLVIASPHPRLGGSMTSPVVNELAYAAARAGRASLRLDYRGVGASEGVLSDDLRDAAADVRAGIDHVLETTRAETIAIAGYSFGAWVALLVAKEDPRIDRVMVVSPPRAALEVDGIPSYADVEKPVIVVLGTEDELGSVAREQVLVAASRTARLHLLPGGNHALRAALVDLARLVPPFLGAKGRDVWRSDDDDRA